MRIVFLFCLLISNLLSAQTKTIDSLRREMYHSHGTEERRKHIIYLLQQQRSMSPDSLAYYVDLLRATLPPNDDTGMLTADAYMVFYYSRKGILDTALALVNRGIKKLETSVKSQSLLTNFYFLRSGVYLKKNNHKEALSCYFQTLRLAEKNRDTFYQIKALNGIGWVYLEMGQHRDALQWLNRALRVSENPKYISLYGVVYTNMVPNYGMLNMIDSVKYYNEKALLNAEQFDDLFSKANILALKASISVYEANYNEAVALMKQAVAIRKVLNDPFYIISDMSTLAYIYGNTGQPEAGIAITKEAIAIARANDLQAKIPLLYKALTYNYEKAGDYKSAASTLRQILDIKDSIYQKAKSEDLAEMQTKYETEKKVSEIKFLQKENELKDAKTKNLLYIAGAIILILLCTGFFTYSYLKIKQKKKLAEEKVKMERMRLQVIIQTQEEERKRISAELHDGIGPVLSAVKLNLSMLEYSGKDMQRYETAVQLIDKSYKELRTVSHMMMPTALLQNGIVVATRQLADTLNISGALNIIVAAENTKRRYDEIIEIQLYRIIQELLNNIVKYARASEVQIQFAEENNELTLMIEDNGNGFDPVQLQQSQGNGWSNVVSRLNILNGVIEIDSHLGKKGSVVFIIIPVK